MIENAKSIFLGLVAAFSGTRAWDPGQMDVRIIIDDEWRVFCIRVVVFVYVLVYFCFVLFAVD